MERKITPEAAQARMADLCARSEQCEADIRQKLYRLGLTSGEVQHIIEALSRERFIDNSRFACAFARDKCRFSLWGRNKIKLALLAKRISNADITKGLGSIDPRDYQEALRRTAFAKARGLDLSGPENRDNRLRLFRHIISRGFESDLASQAIRDLMKNQE